MASVNSIELSIFNAKQFKDSFSESEYANVYFTFGRTLPWENEALPPQADTSESSFYEIWSNMIGAKRITGNDARHCIPRFNWAANTVYTAYDNLIDSKDLKNANTQFYVITDEYRVYKRLSKNENNNTMGIPKVYDFLEMPQHLVLVMELLGSSLDNEFTLCNKKFNIETMSH